VHGRGRALREEVGYWEGWLATDGGNYPEDYARRIDPGAEVDDPALRSVLASIPEGTVSILDVGAGPLSIVGCRFPGLELTIVAVDPLADKYNRLLHKKGLEPPVRTQALAGERLVAEFGEDRFDIAYAHNALDHAVDPAVIIEQMLAVVRPGGHVVLRHSLNEAVQQNYVELHQWNMDERSGELVIWRPGAITNMTHALAGRAEVLCWTETADTVFCVITKPAT
jgi:SAM-dependent methyltransferase